MKIQALLCFWFEYSLVLSLEASDDNLVYIVEGELDTPEIWFGYIANVSLMEGGSFRFRFTYPYQLQVNVI